MMIFFHLLPQASFAVTLHTAQSIALAKEPDRAVLVLAASSHMGHGPVWTKVLVKPPVLCSNRAFLILTQDTGRVHEGSVTGIQTVCAQVRRNYFLDQGFQFQIIFSHTFWLMNPLKERKYPRWALSPPTTSFPCSTRQAEMQQAFSQSYIAKVHHDPILVCYYSQFLLL